MFFFNRMRNGRLILTNYKLNLFIIICGHSAFHIIYQHVNKVLNKYERKTLHNFITFKTK